MMCYQTLEVLFVIFSALVYTFVTLYTLERYVIIISHVFVFDAISCRYSLHCNIFIVCHIINMNRNTEIVH